MRENVANRKMTPTCLEATENRLPPFRSALFAAELPAQFGFCALQRLAPSRRKIPAGPIEVEGQHRQRRTIRIRLAPMAAFRRSLQRGGNRLWILLGEYALRQVQGVTLASDPCRPTMTSFGAA